MLISNSRVTVGDIASLKLTNGDEIVAKVASLEGDYYTLSKPTLVVPSPKGIGLIQAMFSVDPELDIQVNKSHVMIMAPTIDQLQSHYIQVTTGIQTVEKGGLIV